MMLRAILILSIMLWCADACSEVGLIIPIATTHIEYSSNTEEFNNENYGLGLSYSFSSKDEIGALYLKDDSYNNKNYYFYYAKKYHITNDFIFSVALYMPTRYEKVYVAPLWSLTYKFIRVATTYPLGLHTDAGADMVNMQLIIPLGF